MRTSTFGTSRHAFWTLAVLSAAACATPSGRSELPRPAPRVSVAPRSELPVRRVRFYESGVAEFERSGQLRGTMTLLPLPASDIDDVLRTLVIRRGSNLVPVHSANFDTVTLAKAARAQANLPPESKHGFEYSEYVQSLKGERVELMVQNRRVYGRLIEFTPLEIAKDDKSDSSDSDKKPARPKSKAEPKPTEASSKFEWQEFELTILTDQGAIERYHTDKVGWLRPVDPVVIARLGNAVAATSGRAGELSRVLQITSEPGEAVNLTYVTEVPIARITYRLHASRDGQTDTLQGMTLVHNDTDEAWGAVAIEITNEDLDSSVVPFVAPRYWDRPMHATRESGANFVPQLNKSSADSLSESGVSSRVVQGRTASSSTSPRVRMNTDVTTPKLPPNSSRNPPLGHSDYTYAVATKSTIAARSSALLPFLETKVKAERGVWFGQGARAGRSVVRIQNTTSRPLPAGMLSVFDLDRFVGETELTQLEPGKYGYYDYANELKLALSRKTRPNQSETTAP